MKKLIFFAGFVFFSLALIAQECFMIPTETRYWNSSNSYNGYTLFGSGGKTYLIDMEGHVIHQWNIGTNPRFTEAGTLLDAAGGDPSNSKTWKELDWDGNVVWQYTESRSNYHPHHDFTKIYNPKLGDSTFIYIANKDLTSQQCLDAGCNPTNTYTNPQMDAIVEVDRQGNVIWEWWFFNHVVQDIDASKTATYGVIKTSPGKLNLNISGNPVKSDWLHCNSLDYNQDKDLIVINSVHGEFYVIDHGNTFIKGDSASSIALAASTKGDFLYRFGDPAKYNQGDPPSILDNWEKSTTGNKQIGGAHDIQWIKSGLPGEGNFLIFNNGQNLFELTPQSYIFEINPFLTSTGSTSTSYVNPPDAGYNIWVPADAKNFMKSNKNMSKQIVWIFSSKNNVNFYNTIGGSAQRLPNGNTLVCSTNDGHLFEVSPGDTSIVWEYINPVTSKGIKKIKVSTYPHDNSVFRALRYTSTEPALIGHDLTAGKTITSYDPDYIKPSDITSIKGVSESKGSSNKGDVLGQNYPNPFSNITTIDYVVQESSHVSIIVYDLSGNVVKILVNENRISGNYNIQWDGIDNSGSKVSTGMYYYIYMANNQQVNKKMIYIK